MEALGEDFIQNPSGRDVIFPHNPLISLHSLCCSGPRVGSGAAERAVGRAGGRVGDAGVQDQAGQPQAAGHLEEEGETEWMYN